MRTPLVRMIIPLAGLFLTGCLSQEHIEVFDFPDEQWKANEPVVFTFHPEETLSNPGGESIDILVRHRFDFPYADLKLEVRGIRPDRVFWTDTISVPLAEQRDDTWEQYHWLGRRYSNHYETIHRYRERIEYRHFEPDSLQGISSDYTVSIRQISHEENLKGILSVGIVASGCETLDLPH